MPTTAKIKKPIGVKMSALNENPPGWNPIAEATPPMTMIKIAHFSASRHLETKSIAFYVSLC